MLLDGLRWLRKYLGTLALAFILAVVVWVSAVTAADPNQEQQFPQPVPIERTGLDPGLLVMGTVPSQAIVQLNAPKSIWTRLTGSENTLRAWIDLSGLSAGQHRVRVQVQPSLTPVRIVRVDPETVSLTLEPLVSHPISVTLKTQGEPALGYRAGTLTYSPGRVTVSGAESLVAQVKEVTAGIDFSGASHSIETTLVLQPLDINGNPVSGVSLSPNSIQVNAPVSLLGGYRNVIVKVITQGQVALGYKLTNISISPPNVIVFSKDPQLVNDLPGYVETKPLDLTGSQDYIETMVELNLPAGISAVNDQRVLVQVNIAAIESNLAMSLPVEIIGLAPGLNVQVAPSTIDMILSGPLPVLNGLKPSDIRVVVDLSGKGVGVYSLSPRVDFVPARVQVQSILPASLNVAIIIAPTPTVTVTPFPQQTPTPTRKP